ncbi:TAXI family TRAP transporter solute-binding subunit [Nocardiopsis sp. CT-R113]|uniref:TAXI family TRAP transporter solute-binding subunit n=1 Tax=Nocardiopsis codii TaxID=3065942 RepID=A0ABU7K2L8_9ACTN|nr:TAXI family TRAP transporter solute-binding subunit [Nocardiopsis sp. CT-R113]MEE2036444.1 TAXI family TRAP transporter solute-binding subunit [Nocardiopsis sp. CT-R113]
MARSPAQWLSTAAGLLLAVAVTAPLLTWSQTWVSDPLRLSIGTGGEGGVYHVYGSGLAQIATARPDTEITALTTAASVENNLLVASGSLDAAFTLADVAALAVAGDPPFEEPLPITAIARLYDNHTHLVVRADSPYEKVADLAGATVSVGARGSGTEMMADRLLDLAGLRAAPAGTGASPPEDGAVRLQLSIGASAHALENGDVDAFFWSGGLPTQAVTDLSERTPIRLVDLADHVPALVGAYGEYFSELPVPAGTYPGVPSVRTIGVPSLLVAGAAMPDDSAEDLTRLLFEWREQLVRIHPVALHLHTRSAIATLPIPLHPGAAEYYREVKYAYDGPERGGTGDALRPAAGSARRSRAGRPAAATGAPPGVPAG